MKHGKLKAFADDLVKLLDDVDKFNQKEFLTKELESRASQARKELDNVEAGVKKAMEALEDVKKDLELKTAEANAQESYGQKVASQLVKEGMEKKADLIDEGKAAKKKATEEAKKLVLQARNDAEAARKEAEAWEQKTKQATGEFASLMEKLGG